MALLCVVKKQRTPWGFEHLCLYVNSFVLKVGYRAMGGNQFLIEMGKRIVERRKVLKKTQEQVAEEIGISLQSVSCIELGKKAIRPDNLVKLCIALDTTADYILTGTRPDKQVNEIYKILSKLSPEDYKMVEDLIYRLNDKAKKV